MKNNETSAKQGAEKDGAAGAEEMKAVKSEKPAEPEVKAEPEVELAPRFEVGETVKHASGKTFEVLAIHEAGVHLKGVANLVDPKALTKVRKG